MEKVKLTQKQADEIERIKRIGFPTRWRDDGWYIERDEALNGLSFYQYINAVLKGYEVEPEFKVGDWITYDADRYGNGIKNITQIEEIKCSNYWNEECAFWDTGSACLPLDIIRHATSQEIAEEKERRWWAKHDRGVWEIREGDALIYIGVPYIVDWFNSEEVRFKSGKCNSGFMENFDYVKEYFKVFCFVEDRKDA